MIDYPSIVRIFDYRMFYIISNGNVNMRSIDTKDLILSVLSIIDAFHAYIENNMPITCCLYVNTSVACIRWLKKGIYVSFHI